MYIPCISHVYPIPFTQLKEEISALPRWPRLRRLRRQRRQFDARLAHHRRRRLRRLRWLRGLRLFGRIWRDRRLEIHRFWFFDRRLFRIQCWVMNVMNSANSIRNAQKDQESSTVATPRPERELKGPIISLADCSATTQRSGCRP